MSKCGSLNERCRYGAGFVLGGEEGPLGPNLSSFGHNGWGGAYVMNRMLGRGEALRVRRRRMIEAVYAAL